MSGVSISESNNIDLDAIVAGGDDFMARVKTLQQAKSDSAAALDALNIGRDVVAAMQDAQAREAQALKLVEQAKADSENVIAAATAQADKIRGQAQTEADALMASAKSQSDGIEQEVLVARAALNAWSSKTRTEADAVMAKAIETNANAEKQWADNRQAAELLATAQAEAQAAITEANNTQAALAAKLDAIKAAAS